MRAAVCTRYDDLEALSLVDLPIPTPGPHELLVRVRATTVSSADWRLRTLTTPPGFSAFARLAFGLTRPRRPILGSELAGEVAAIGSRVTRFRVGDEVFAFTGLRLGCHAEYGCVREDGMVAMKPPKLDFGQAAALSFGGATMLDFFERAALRAGERVLVNGASGAVGTAAVQLACHAGARVTAVCSATNADLVASLGADRVIDYQREDFAHDGTRYDLIVDTAGTAPWSRSAPALAPGGRLLLVLASLPEMLRAPWHGLRGSRRVIAGPAAERPRYIHRLRELALQRAFVPVVGRRFDFERIADAHAYVAQGHKRGNAVVLLRDSEPVGCGLEI